MIFRGDVLENIVSDTAPLLTSGFVYEALLFFLSTALPLLSISPLLSCLHTIRTRSLWWTSYFNSPSHFLCYSVRYIEDSHALLYCLLSISRLPYLSCVPCGLFPLVREHFCVLFRIRYWPSAVNHLLRNHGLGKPLTRQCFPVIVTLMLIASTVLRVLELCHLSPPTILADEEILTLVFRIEECDITIRWLSILNVGICLPSQVVHSHADTAFTTLVLSQWLDSPLESMVVVARQSVCSWDARDCYG